MSVAADIMVFWGILVLCNKGLLRRFGGSYCFHLQVYWTLFRLCETTLMHTESGGSTFFRNVGTYLSTRCYKRKQTVFISSFSLQFEQSALLIIPKRVCLQPWILWLKYWASTSRLILAQLSYTQQLALTEECRTNFVRHSRRTEAADCTPTVPSHPYCCHTTPSAVNSVHGFLSYPAKTGPHPTACVRNDEPVALMLHVPSISGAILW